MPVAARTQTVRWMVTPLPPVDRIDELMRACDLPRPIAAIMINRGMDTPELVDQFLSPKLARLEDPFSLLGMRAGVDRVCKALRENEKIVVYGDYDVDGITATSLLYLTMNRLGAQVSYYLPNRLVEGYGLSKQGIDVAKGRGCSLIVTVDTGITAVKEIEYAREQGIEVVVTDHHEPSAVTPPAAAIVNPKMPGSNYRGGELSGVGVAFKFAQGLYQTLGQNGDDLYEHLDLVALGTSADIVPLSNENRILTYFGINQITRTNKPGLKWLFHVAGLQMDREFSANHIVFVLAPRINAVGRLGDATLAIKLLTTRDDRLASEIAHRLEDENRRRKAIDEETLNQAVAQITREVDLEGDSAIVLSSPGWHQGVIGIVASRIVEMHHLPTVMIAVDNGIGRGSARSIPGFHIYDALRECEDLLEGFGGHKYAAGLVIRPERIEEFSLRFKEVSRRTLADDALIPKLHIDAEVELEQVTPELLDTLDKFAPFGPQNMRPLFLTRNCEVVGDPMKVGRNHLRMRVRKGDAVFDTIGFGLGEMTAHLPSRGALIDIAYLAEYNFWRDAKRMQLQLKDVRFSTGSLNTGIIG